MGMSKQEILEWLIRWEDEGLIDIVDYDDLERSGVLDDLAIINIKNPIELSIILYSLLFS